MSNPFLTDKERETLAAQNSPYNKVMQGYNQAPQQQDSD